jgi:hypothetical protein
MVGHGDELDGFGGEARRREAVAHDRRQRPVRADGLFAAAQNDRIARLRQSAAVSTRTFGRDSKTTATTPKGSRTFRMVIPLGRRRCQIVSPTGSGRAAT